MTAFKKEALDKLVPGMKRFCVSDEKLPGLRLVIYSTGVKTYIFYRRVDGIPQRIKIGRYESLTIEQARKKAKELDSLITLGGNPHKEKLEARKAITFKELYNAYYNKHAVPFTKRPLESKRSMELHVFPEIGNMKAGTITPKDISGLYVKIGNKVGKPSKDDTKKGYINANRIIGIVSAAFNFGIKEGYSITKNPCTGLKKVKAVSRDRFLTYQELQSFFQALELEDDLFRDLFKILLYTGARKTNVLSMKWSDINFELKRWRLSETQTKNKDINIVLLSDLALEILQTRKTRLMESGELPSYVFSGDSKTGHLTDPKKAFNRIKKEMKVYDIRIHDLRRTLGSYMAISGASLPMIGKALNHKSHISTAIYARLSQEPVLAAVNIASAFMNNYLCE